MSLPVVNTRESARRLEALTSLRFFAAAMIVVLHTRGFFGVPDTLLAPFTLGQGVTFFFVLSGFILAYVYPALDRRGTLRFYVARIARIWPLHVVGFVLFLAAVPRATPPVPGSNHLSIAVLNLALLHAWIPMNRFQFSFDAPSWSISVEFFFYACFPLLIARWHQTWAVKLGGALTLALTAVLIANYGLQRFPAGTTVVGLVYNLPLARLWEFSLGIATAHLWRHLRTRIALSRFYGTLLELATLGGALLVMYQSLAWTLALNGTLALGNGGFLWMLETGFVSVPFAALLCVLALEQGEISRLLSWSPLVLLGEISFSIYLLHIPILLYILYHPQHFARIPQGELYALYWLLVVVAAYVSWSVIEYPGRRLVVAWWDRRFGRRLSSEVGNPPIPSGPRLVPRLTTPTWWGSLLALCVLCCIGVVLAR